MMKADEKVAVLKAALQVVALAAEKMVEVEMAVAAKAEVTVAAGWAEATEQCSCRRRASRRYHS